MTTTPADEKQLAQGRTAASPAAPVRPTPPGRPPRWKQTILTFVGIYPMLTVFQMLFGEKLAALSLPVRVLIIVAVIAPLATYVVFPLLTKLAGPLMRPAAPRSRTTSRT